MVNILIGCTGSVATIKLPILVQQLLENENYKVAVIATQNAFRFFDLNEIPDTVRVYKDEDEWTTWTKRGDPILHIDLGKWADLMVIAPLDANTLGKIANGLCDNLLSSTVRAWELTKPLLFCPAMNTKMYDHPLTAEQINKLIAWGYHLIPVIEKTLVCGDTGLGAMAEVKTIIETINQNVQKMKIPNTS